MGNKKKIFCDCRYFENQVCDICTGNPSNEVMELRSKFQYLEDRIIDIEKVLRSLSASLHRKFRHQ